MLWAFKKGNIIESHKFFSELFTSFTLIHLLNVTVIVLIIIIKCDDDKEQSRLISLIYLSWEYKYLNFWTELKTFLFCVSCFSNLLLL